MKARDHIKSSLAAVSAILIQCHACPPLDVLAFTRLLSSQVDGHLSSEALSPEMASRIQALEKENSQLKKITDELRALVLSLDSRVKSLEGSKGGAAPAAAPQPPKPAAKKEEDDDDDVDLFGSDEEEDEEAERIKEERLAAYAAKKSKSKTSGIIEIHSANEPLTSILSDRTCSDCQIQHHFGREAVGR